MVAYSFDKLFAHQVEAGAKRQTIRAYRKRHARLGERVQLYTGMRTRHCRKLVDPDPKCVCVDAIEIRVPDLGKLSGPPAVIRINAIPLNDREVEDLACADGFHLLCWRNADREWVGPPAVSAAALMGRWWFEKHGPGLFEGVLIKWRPPKG